MYLCNPSLHFLCEVVVLIVLYIDVKFDTFTTSCVILPPASYIIHCFSFQCQAHALKNTAGKKKTRSISVCGGSPVTKNIQKLKLTIARNILLLLMLTTHSFNSAGNSNKAECLPTAIPNDLKIKMTCNY